MYVPMPSFQERLMPPVPECVRAHQQPCSRACTRALEQRAAFVQGAHFEPQRRAARRADFILGAVYGRRLGQQEITSRSGR